MKLIFVNLHGLINGRPHLSPYMGPFMCLAIRRLDYQNRSAVAAMKKSGGLCLAWLNGVDIGITYSDKNIIYGHFFSDPLSVLWMLSTVYGPSCKTGKACFWRKLQ